MSSEIWVFVQRRRYHKADDAWNRSFAYGFPAHHPGSPAGAPWLDYFHALGIKRYPLGGFPVHMTYCLVATS